MILNTVRLSRIGSKGCSNKDNFLFLRQLRNLIMTETHLET